MRIPVRNIEEVELVARELYKLGYYWVRYNSNTYTIGIERMITNIREYYSMTNHPIYSCVEVCWYRNNYIPSDHQRQWSFKYAYDESITTLAECLLLIKEMEDKLNEQGIQSKRAFVCTE